MSTIPMALPLMSSTSSSVEYNVFTLVVVSLLGGPSQVYDVFLRSKPCLGLVGNSKFCTKILEGGLSSPLTLKPFVSLLSL